MNGIRTMVNIRKLINVAKAQKGFLVFGDIRRVYDSVLRQSLFRKLKLKNLPNEDETKYMEAWHSMIRVAIDNLSKAVKCYQGVIQGSILTPFLFNILIVDFFPRTSFSRNRFKEHFWLRR